MPFTVIRGTFHLVGKTAAGKPSGFEPDGDSMHFKPANPALLQALPRVRFPLKPSAIGSVQLRFEGIDALELHYRADAGGPFTSQPRPLADQARDALTGLLKMNPVAYAQPDGRTVLTPTPRDAVPGYILSRTLEANGRPVAFVFAGSAPPPAPDGASVTLTVAMLRRSLNYKLVRSGNAYPLFYEGLFADIRESLSTAARRARKEGAGLWAQDRSISGLTIANGTADLVASGVIFPKLYRRLIDYFAAVPGATLDGFPAWLKKTREQVLDLPETNFTHFDNMISVDGDDTIRMLRHAEDMVFISAK